MKKAIVSVTNDLVTDQRVQRTNGVLKELGFQVHFVGRKLPGSLPASFSYPHTRFKLWFTKGFLFYAHYNLRLFWFLLTHRFDLYLANDLDTLLPQVLVARFRKKPLVYDSHEYFTGVPEIQHRPFVKWVWTKLERWLLPKANAHITVNQSIAQLFASAYDVPFTVIRNIGNFTAPSAIKSRQDLHIPENTFLLINQGAGINVDRGMEEVLEALLLLPQDVHLLIVGNGDAVPQLKKETQNKGLQNRVHFIPKQPYQQMLQYTLNADCGLSLDKDSNLNYRYSLPNKLFDYINCGLPLVVSNLVEVAGLVRKYHIGEVCPNHSPEHIAKAIQAVRQNGKEQYRQGLQTAAAENSWTQEKQKLKAVLSPFA